MGEKDTNKKLLLFDLDGTLLDSREFLVSTSFNTLEKHFSGKFSYEQVADRFGDGFKRYLSTETPAQNEIAIQEFVNIKLKHYHQNALPFPGVLDGLRYLKKNGYVLGIVTNQMKQISENAMQECGMLELMDVVIGVEDVDDGKPSPEGIHQALKKLGKDRTSAVMVGDSQADMLAAQNAGVESYLLTWYEDVNVAGKCNPDNICPNFNVFVEMLNQKENAI